MYTRGEPQVRRWYFGIRRFDRHGYRRIHMQSLSGLLRADHRTLPLDYDATTHEGPHRGGARFPLRTLLRACPQPRRPLENVSFLLDDAMGNWTLAPAYDLTFSSPPGGQQSILVIGQGRASGVEHLRALGKKRGIKEFGAFIDDVRAAIADSSMIQHSRSNAILQRVDRIGGRRRLRDGLLSRRIPRTVVPACLQVGPSWSQVAMQVTPMVLSRPRAVARENALLMTRWTASNQCFWRTTGTRHQWCWT
jgi:hypothetical protein